jgi:hypothetical protein
MARKRFNISAQSFEGKTPKSMKERQRRKRRQRRRWDDEKVSENKIKNFQKM